jgi:gamma-glutamyl phosphate reductase
MSVLAGQPQASIEPMMLYMGRLAREAAQALALATTAQKNAALEAMAKRI